MKENFDNVSKPRRFIKPSRFAYVIAAIALLYLVREFEYAGLRRNKSGEFAKLRETFLEPHPCDILFIGSSRAECQFYPPVIDSATKLHSFNIGMMGATMPFIRAGFEAYLENSPPPKYVVLNLDLHTFADSPDTVYQFPRYFAFLSNEKLYEGLQYHDKRFRYFKTLPFYSLPYFGSHYLDASLRGWLGRPGNYDSLYVQGFSPSVPNNKAGSLDTMAMPSYASVPRPFVRENLDRIVEICNAKHITLILVISPLFHRWQESVINYDTLVDDFKRYAGDHQLLLLDLGNDSLRDHAEYYADPAHLNRTGAILFSRHFSGVLTQYIGR